jgi:hypothetical protein
MNLPPYGDTGEVSGESGKTKGEGNAIPEPTRDHRPSRNYEFVFLFSKRPKYYFDRAAIDVSAQLSHRPGDRAIGDLVWETESETFSDAAGEPGGIWRINLGSTPLSTYCKVAPRSGSPKDTSHHPPGKHCPRPIRRQRNDRRGGIRP